MINTYLISAPVRTGSNYLHGVIGGACQDGQRVVKTHNPYHECDYPTTFMIILNRRDRLAAVTSALVADQLKQYTSYEISCPQPFAADPEKFLYHYFENIQHYSQHDLSRPYAMVKRMYFEDFVDNYNYVYQQLGYEFDYDLLDRLGVKLFTDFAMPPKCPYRPQEVLTNYRELQGFFESLEKHRTHLENLQPTTRLGLTMPVKYDILHTRKNYENAREVNFDHWMQMCNKNKI
jgi:hypothetical protein